MLLEGDEGTNGETGEDMAQKLTELEDEPKITLHALIGWTTPKSIRVMTNIGQHNLVVLNNSGFTDNFISEKIISLL